MTVQSLQLQSLRSNFLLPIVYQLTLDAALKFHGKSQIPAWSWKTPSQRLPLCLNRKKHIVCKLNIRSISLLWTNQLRFFCQLVWNFLFLLIWSYVLFLSKFSLLYNLIVIAGCSTPIMCRHISWTLYYAVRTLTELTVLSSNLINSHTTLLDLIAIEGIPTGNLCTA